jgi:hypothetical protein
MPQINQKSNQPSATSIKENKPFRDRLRDRYAPTDYVRVINIDNEPFQWQYFPSTGEQTYFTDNGAVRVVEGRQAFTKNYELKTAGNEQVWVINPGSSEILIGENADLFIEGLYKELVVKKRIEDNPNIEKTQARSFNWNDGLLQEQMIDKIFLGIERPVFDEPKRSGTDKKK